MKIKILTLSLTFFLLNNINGQEKKLTLEFEEMIGDAFKLNEQGLVIQTYDHPMGVIVKKGKLKYIDLDMNLKWDIPSRPGSGKLVVSNISGSKIYHLQDVNPLGHQTALMSLKQVTTKTGTIKNHTIKKETWGLVSPKKAQLKAVFANESSLCFLSTSRFYVQNSKKSLEQKLILYKVNHNDFSGKKISLKLPLLKTEAKKTFFWSFEAHDEEGFYLSSTFEDKTDNGFTIHYTIIKLNYDGELINEVKLNFERENVTDLYGITSKGTDPIHRDAYFGRGSQLRKCAVKIDTKSNQIYLFSRDKFKNKGEQNNVSLFIKKYNFDGKLIWEKSFDKGGGTTISSLINNQEIKFGFLNIATENIWVLSSNGELIDEYVNHKHGWDGFKLDKDKSLDIQGVLTPKEGTPAYNYFKKNKGKDKVFTYVEFESKDVLIENNKNTKKLNIMTFPK